MIKSERKNYKLNFEVVKPAFKLLNPKSRLRLFFLTSIQIIVGLLDLVGIAIIGLIGTLAVKGVQSSIPDGRVTLVLDLLNLNNSTIQVQVGILGSMAAGLLISRTFLSMYFSRKTLFFLGAKSADSSKRLSQLTFADPEGLIRFQDPQRLLFALTSGVEVVVIKILGAFLANIVDLSLLILIFLTMFFVSPSVAVGAALFFAALGLILNRYLNTRAQLAGIKNTKLHIASNSQILGILKSHREIHVWGRGNYVANAIGQSRSELANVASEVAFMPAVTKFVIEIAIVISIFLLSASQFLLTDAPNAVATLGVFLAAGMRIGPAVLRVQQGILQIGSAIGQAQPTFELIELLGNSMPKTALEPDVSSSHSNFEGNLALTNINYCYPGDTRATLANVNLNIDFGTTVAIVGPSGSGKSTLVDLILGLLEPTSGQILIGGLSPIEVIKKWPGVISYAPQAVNILNGTIKENILFTLGEMSELQDRLDLVIDQARLGSWIKSLPDGVETVIGEAGVGLSGGQAQRVGIARALITAPKFIILDESTSALDGQTETEIVSELSTLKGKATVFIVAHRLSTIANADIVVYLENGAILAVGSIEEVRKSVPNFDKQAKSMGLA
jgi:ABC-type multidrug transport system fused ATPase/permease subunit